MTEFVLSGDSCVARSPLISDVGRRVTEGERAAGTSAQQRGSQGGAQDSPAQIR